MNLVSFVFNHHKAHLRAAVSMDDDNDGDGWQSKITNKYFHYYLLLDECSISQYRSRILTEYREISSARRLATNNHKRRIFFSFTVWSNWSVLTQLCAPSRKRKKRKCSRRKRASTERPNRSVRMPRDADEMYRSEKATNKTRREWLCVLCVFFFAAMVSATQKLPKWTRAWLQIKCCCMCNELIITHKHTHTTTGCCSLLATAARRDETHKTFATKDIQFLFVATAAMSVYCYRVPTVANRQWISSALFPFNSIGQLVFGFWIAESSFVAACECSVLQCVVCAPRDALFSMQRRRRRSRRRRRWNWCSPHSPDISHD